MAKNTGPGRRRTLLDQTHWPRSTTMWTRPNNDAGRFAGMTTAQEPTETTTENAEAGPARGTETPEGGPDLRALATRTAADREAERPETD